MYNLLGQNVPVSWDNTYIDVSGFSGGPYILEISSDGEKYVEKIIVSDF